MSTLPADELAAVADELYSLPPDEFTAARNARAKAAKARGERELAALIAKLGRPSAAAGLANLLVRRSPESLRPLLDLGVALRQATAALDGAAMRELSRQQAGLVSTAVREAKGFATDADRKVSESTLRELEGTLRAAIADAGLAEQLIAGRLTGALEHTGFGPAPAGHLTVVPPLRDTAVAPDRARVGPPPEAPDPADARDDAVAAVETAQSALEQAVAERKQAAAQLVEVERLANEQRRRVEELRRDLSEAQTQLSQAERRQTQAKEAVEHAGRATRAAARRLEDAATRLDDLS